jgi:hypothetical protein
MSTFFPPPMDNDKEPLFNQIDTTVYPVSFPMLPRQELDGPLNFPKIFDESLDITEIQNKLLEEFLRKSDLEGNRVPVLDPPEIIPGGLVIRGVDSKSENNDTWYAYLLGSNKMIITKICEGTGESTVLQDRVCSNPDNSIEEIKNLLTDAIKPTNGKWWINPLAQAVSTQPTNDNIYGNKLADNGATWQINTDAVSYEEYKS